MFKDKCIFPDPSVTNDPVEPIEYVWSPDSIDPADRFRDKVLAEGYRFFFDDVVLVKRGGGSIRIGAYRAHDINSIAKESDDSIRNNTCVLRYDHPVGSGYFLCVIPLTDKNGIESARNRAEKKLDHLFGDSYARLGNIYFDRRRVNDIAGFCGCGTDISSFVSSGNPAFDIDTLFCSGAVTVIALMFRRIGLRRGFNLKTDIIDFTVYLSFNALVYENNDEVFSDEEFINGIQEIEILNLSANARGIPLNVMVLHDEKYDGARRIAIRFCSKNDPYRQKEVLSATDKSERSERIRRIRRRMTEFPFDTSGKY